MIVAVPNVTPKICGWVAGVSAPAAIKTDGVTVTEGESLVRETVRPPEGAGSVKVTGNGAG